MDVLRTMAASTKASLRRFAIVVAILALLVPMASGQTATERTAFDTISGYLTESGADSVEHRLEKVGFTAPMEKGAWHQLPAVRKIEMAWCDAEAAQKGTGQDLLALLSRNLAQSYDAVRYEPALKSYLAHEPPKVLHFSHVTTPAPELAPDVQKAIQVLSGYADGGAFGSAQATIVRYSGKTPDEAYQVLRTSKSTSDALKKVWSELSPDKQDVALRQLVVDVTTAYPAAQHEPALKTLRPFMHAPVARLGPKASPVPKQSLSESQTRPDTSPTERFAQHVTERAKPAAGGVVFDGAVTPDPTMRKILRLKYDLQSQLLAAELDGKREVVFGPVDLELVAIAHGVIAVEETKPSPGAPFIFVGLTAPVEESQCLPKQRSVRTAALRYRVIARPSIADSRLGWAMTRLDAYPAHSESLAREVETRGDSLAASKIRSIFHCPYATTWTITDVPLSVGSQEDRIVLRRAKATTELSERLRSSAFLSMRVEEKPGESCGLSQRFVRELPLLMRTSEDIRLVNQFAAVFAIVKLAKTQGASFELPSNQSAGSPLPSALRISDEGVESIADYSVSEERKRESVRSARCWTALEPLQ